MGTQPESLMILTSVSDKPERACRQFRRSSKSDLWLRPFSADFYVMWLGLALEEEELHVLTMDDECL